MFEVGHKKHGGRKKGSVNKRTRALMAVEQLCEEKGFNPFEAMLELAQTARSQETRLNALKEICKYIQPQKKAIEHSGEISNPYAAKPLEELERLVKEKLND